VILTFRYRLLPSRQQHARLADILEQQRQLYNAALEERIDGPDPRRRRARDHTKSRMKKTIVRVSDPPGDRPGLVENPWGFEPRCGSIFQLSGFFYQEKLRAE
jgi:hypothetical protein